MRIVKVLLILPLFFSLQAYGSIYKQALRAKANHGDGTVQYLFGVMYYKGQGVERNYVHAYKWLSLAHAEGNLRGTGKLLNMLEKSMTSPQIAQAQKLANQFTV